MYIMEQPTLVRVTAIDNPNRTLADKYSDDSYSLRVFREWKPFSFI